jgi:hypothetical protein
MAAEISARPERPLELRLAPAELGGLTLNLRQDGDILRVVLQADRPDTLDLLRRNGDILLDELRLEGFAGASLSFEDGGGAQGRRSLSAPPPALSSGDLSALAPRPGAPSPNRPALAQQGLDLRL